MVKVLHLSDIHLGSGFSHGYVNPDTGLNSRFEDFVRALQHCIDRALAESVDLVLFGGDAFPTATPPPYAQDAFATQFRRLVEAQIPTVMLVGNHDQFAQGQGGASLCIYRALGVPDVIVGDRLATHRINTRHGKVQVITLPWINHSTLLTRPETEGRTMVEINELLLSRLRIALEGEIRQLDDTVPTILLAHLMVDTAHFGAEKFLAVGKGLAIPMALLSRSCFDYVALGHVHRHQILGQEPPIIYPGSIERVDFSEEAEEKGYVLADVQRGSATFQFCTTPARPFRTLRVDLSKAENPHEVLLRSIQDVDVENAVVRLIYYLRPDQMESLHHADIQNALDRAHTYTIHPELVSQLAHPRLPELGLGRDMSPTEALKAYVAHQPTLQNLAQDLLSAAESLLTQQDDVAPYVLPILEAGIHEISAHETSGHYDASDIEQAVNQLRLL
ncbi:MAG: exonuclease subunit SbcD [Leptolyngbyaceae bacterium]|nr:exonuclease subunit SbcD [Leptolyngbyaceae bacterium]